MMTKENLHQRELATYVVRNLFELNLFYKVRDHCHYTEKYSRAAHLLCNLHYKKSSYI